MIKSITVTTHLGDSIKLELDKPELSGFVVKSIDGLGPGKATINTTEVSTNDGGLFNSARMSNRNITINIAYFFNEKETIEELRLKSYKYFPVKKKITLLFETDSRNAEIEGYVESNEPNIFSRQEETSISIICPDPFFYSQFPHTTIFSGIEPLFEFPFSNESLRDDLIEIGIVEYKTEELVVYRGDADIGLTITIHAVGSASGISIHNIQTREIMRLDSSKLEELTGTDIVNGDDIIISTIKGKKAVTLIRNGQSVNILNCLTRDSEWFQLTKGDNIFAYTAEAGAANLQFKIENKVAYEGV